MFLKPAALCAWALTTLAQAVEFRAATFNIGTHFTTAGLPKSGSPLAAGTSAASDHYALFADFELDSAATGRAGFQDNLPAQ